MVNGSTGNVSIAEGNTGYDYEPPFHPDELFPEFGQYASILDKRGGNHCYKLLRDNFRLLNYDIDNYGEKNWNPLGWLINPGQTVFIKPNMISHKHRLNEDWDYVITNGSVIRAVVDYIILAMNGKGRIIIGDAPQTDSVFSEIVRIMGLKEIRDVYKSLPELEIEILNLQDEYWIQKKDIYIETIKLPGDSRGGMAFDLGKNSYFSEFDGKNKKYYGAHYNIEETNFHHNDERHEYYISKSPLFADVFINIPKLKTHKKCGITVNLKSLVGINANKNWLPHYMFGSPESGGDQFPVRKTSNKIENKIVIAAKTVLLKKNPVMQFAAKKLKKVAYLLLGDTEKVVRSGNWHGNDTVWRMSLDLNKILLYGNPDGSFKSIHNPRKYFSVVDGIISMEGNGPVAGEKKETGILVAGTDPVAVDAVCAKVMGFDWKKLPIIERAFDKSDLFITKINYDDIEVVSSNKKYNKKLNSFKISDSFQFKPHFGWINSIEDKDAVQQ